MTGRLDATMPPAPRRVLVVDDDEHTRELLRDLCEALHHEVGMATDGVEALEQVEAFRPDLVLLDLMMPRKDGFGVLRGLRESPTWKDLPVILLTAMGDLDGKIRGMELGADDYVTKPFRLVELQTRIHSVFLVREYRSRLKAAEDELGQLRAVDPSTGAGTYSQLKVSLDGEMARARRYGRPVSTLLLGIDEHSRLRLEVGRETLETFIGRLGHAIRDALRGADRLFRLEADAFVVLLPETDLSGARISAQRLVELSQALWVECGHQGFLLRVRVGGAVFPSERVQSSEDLLREANRSYRSLREAGGDASTLFDA